LQAGRRLAFFGVEQRLVAALPWPSLLIGEQPEWAADSWPEALKASSSLREQLRRARAKGVSVRTAGSAELASSASPLRRALEALVAAWLARHEMAPMGFLVQVDPLTLLEEHRVHVAEQSGRVVGFLSAAPIFARPGWLLQNLIRAPDAPNGTTELLVDHAMRTAEDEAEGDDSPMVTLGLAPLAGQVVPALRLARSAGSVLFDFEGLRAFKARLRPTRWRPIHLVYPPDQGALVTLRDVLEAFARGHLLAFGIRSLLRGPTLVVRLLAAMLVPWTVLLAVTDGWHFPAPWVRWAWVAFDVVLAAALFRLAVRWSDRLSRAVVAAVGVDAVVTLAEALAWNVPRLRGLKDGLISLVAVAAPSLAFVILWRARVRRHAPPPLP
ncbi:MAG TPA: phosphatidylglycerol lysyltransferase domain-containing protein, partial [Myxococcaceae bacterium]|nr:phosphatidylglycerol lysyltransferase domain-containing protein [Myxococcaceae bacterium]